MKLKLKNKILPPILEKSRIGGIFFRSNGLIFGYVSNKRS